MSVFASIPIDSYLFESDYFFVVEDKFPVSEGHLLIISKRVVLDFFSLNIQEKKDITLMIDKCKLHIENMYKPDGYNIGMNCGVTAGQTVMHFHCHVIPRYNGDMRKPDGGVRHCVEGRGYY
jgi:diadenosine tetraphosphate (Ap4A) HIT family hydrolase